MCLKDLRDEFLYDCECRMRPLSHTRRPSTGHSKNKVWKSKRETQRKLDRALLATVFMPKSKGARTYDEMVDDLKTY